MVSNNQLFHLFLFLCFSQITCLHAQLCTQEQTSALLQFKQQFSFNNSPSFDLCDYFSGILSYPKMESWKEGSDCCSWDGIECDNKTSQVIGLDLSCSWLNGTIHPNTTIFYYFPHLQSLNLAFNHFGMSPISSEFSRFTRLTHLNLSDSSFSGKVPIEVSFLSKLVSLDLSYNHGLRLEEPGFELLVQNLTTKVRELNLDSVNISSVVSNSLLNLTSLTHLDLRSRELLGKFPDGIFHLPHLNELWILDNLALTGYFPEYINSSSPLQYLVLGYTNFSGELPDSIGNLKVLERPLPSQIIGLPNLVWLSLDDNLINGTIPSWVFSLPALEYFNLSNNKLTGHVKEFKSTLLTVVDLSNNNLHGRFPSSTFKLVKLSTLILSSNNFSGEADMLCHAIFLQILVLSSNNFNGSIPQCLGNFSIYFSVLDLRKNNFSGTIPDTFAKENSFETINLDSNGFEGSVPKSLENCKMLQVLDLGRNKFSDKFPYWLENLTSLQVLILRSNKFHGPIPNSKFKFPFPNLRVMDLSNNYFTGPLPRKYFKNLNAMMNVDEASFELQYLGMPGRSAYYYNDCLTIVIKGSTIEMVKVLTIFTAIDLSKNNFEDLSSNKLTGEIPQQLRNLKSLEVLNLSQNQLIGPIPQGNQFDTFLNGSYIDNLALCGPPLLNACNPRTPQPPPLMFQQEDNTSSGSIGKSYYRVIYVGWCWDLLWDILCSLEENLNGLRGSLKVNETKAKRDLKSILTGIEQSEISQCKWCPLVSIYNQFLHSFT
ncbi:hypothetical protein ACSBR1_025741 [Camellia fascicularis]